MSAVGYFLGKELLEAWRRHHLLVLGIIFLILGLESPLIAKLTPALFKATLDTQVQLPEPTSVDAWQQFYKAVSQIGIFILAAMLSGSISNEVTRGTLTTFVTRGLSRRAVLAAKYLMGLLLWIGAVLLAFGVTWGYTSYYFPDHNSPHPVLAMLPLLLFGCLFVAMTLFGSALITSSFGGFFTAAGGYLLMLLLALVKPLKKCLPIRLINDNLAMVQGHQALSDLNLAYGVTIVLTIVFLSSTLVVFDHKRL